MISNIGAGAGKFLRVRRIFARIFPNLPEKFWTTLPANFFPIFFFHQNIFWDDLSKKVFMCFSANVGRHFAQIFRNFA